MSNAAPARRRGADLERALLTAAWNHLQRVGYQAFSMDAVALEAKTSKPVLYRRWRSRAELIHATMRTFACAPDLAADSGALRTDAIRILAWLSDRFRDYPDIVGGLMAELPRVEQPVAQSSYGALQRAVELAIGRGEIMPEKVSGRLIRVPLDLLCYQIFVTRLPVPIEEIEEIVDDVFLPALRWQAHRPATAGPR